MQAGTLTKRITLQKPGAAVDDFGQPVPGAANWIDVATVWAAIRPAGTRERLAAQQTQASVSHVITTRYTEALAAGKAAWRIVLGTRIFALGGLPRCPDEERQWLLWEAQENSHG